MATPQNSNEEKNGVYRVRVVNPAPPPQPSRPTTTKTPNPKVNIRTLKTRLLK